MRYSELNAINSIMKHTQDFENVICTEESVSSAISEIKKLLELDYELEFYEVFYNEDSLDELEWVDIEGENRGWLWTIDDDIHNTLKERMYEVFEDESIINTITKVVKLKYNDGFEFTLPTRHSLNKDYSFLFIKKPN